MPVTSVDEMWSRSNSDAKLTDKFRKFEISFTRAFQVLHTVDTTKLEIYQASGIPAAGSSYPGFPFCFADQAQVQQISPVYHIVTVNYTGEMGASGGNGGPTGGAPSPLFAPPKIDWDDVETEEDVDEDFDGNPIVTKAFEPIQGIKRPIPDQTVTIRRNFPFFNPYIQARYRQAVNSDTYLGWPAGTGRITKFSASNVADPVFGYWEVTATIQFRYPYRTTPDKAWYKRVRHEGFYELVNVTGGGTRVVRSVDTDKKPVTKPVLLDANGYRLPDGDPPHWLEFKIFDSLPFGALGLI